MAHLNRQDSTSFGQECNIRTLNDGNIWFNRRLVALKYDKVKKLADTILLLLVSLELWQTTKLFQAIQHLWLVTGNTCT